MLQPLLANPALLGLAVAALICGFLLLLRRLPTMIVIIVFVAVLVGLWLALPPTAFFIPK